MCYMNANSFLEVGKVLKRCVSGEIVVCFGAIGFYNENRVLARSKMLTPGHSRDGKTI